MAKRRREAIEVGLQVRRRRKALSWSLEKLAERADLTPQYIGAIENGLRDPSLSTMEKIAYGLGVSTGALLGPAPELSQKAIEMARLFDQASREIQDAMLLILRSASKL